MTNKHKPIGFCPFCGTVAADMIGAGKTFWVECRNPLCGASGPVQRSAHEACVAWDIRVDKDESGCNVLYEPVVYEPDPVIITPKRKH